MLLVIIIFFFNKASWHHACYQKFTNSKLDPVITRLLKGDGLQCLQHSKSYCLFCNEDGDLINFSTKNSKQ